jgi:hypothetical protein
VWLQRINARLSWKWLATFLVIYPAGLLHAAEPPRSTTAPGEPFASFRILDSQLFLLDAQFHQLKSDGESIQKLRSAKERRRAYHELRRSKALREIRSTAGSIRMSTHALRSQERIRRSPYGRVAFRGLDRRALAMKRSLQALATAKNARQTRTRLKGVSRAMIALVLHYQAVSGGYGALRCGPGGWTCCHPKPVQAKGKPALNGCRWVCVEKAARCRSGCLGPRTPSVTAQQLRSPRSSLR